MAHLQTRLMGLYMNRFIVFFDSNDLVDVDVQVALHDSVLDGPPQQYLELLMVVMVLNVCVERVC